MTESDLLPRRYNKELDSFQKLADALGEPVENVYNMPEKERSELMTVMQIDITVAVTPVKRVPSSHDPGPSLSQASDGDKSEASAESRKRKKSGGKRPFDYDSDDDFVPNESEKDKKFKFNYEEMEKDFLSVYDDGSKPSSSRRQPTRAAARRTNQKNKNLNNDDISLLLDNNGEDGDDQPNLAPLPNDLNFSKTKENPTESSAKMDSVHVEKLPNLDLKKDEEYSLILKRINAKAKKPLLIEHTRDPMKLLEENLPTLRIKDLRAGRKESKKTDLDRFTIHMSVIKGISKEVTHSANEESMSWLKLSSSRRKTVPIKWSKEEEKPTDDVDCEDAFFDLNIDEPLINRVASNLKDYKIPKNITISPVPTPSTSSSWLSKPMSGASSKSQGSKLKLKKPTEKPKITLDHFYDEAKQEKPSSSRSDSDETRQRRLSEKILQHLRETDESTTKEDENDEEVKFVKEVASPYSTSRRKDTESKETN